MLLSVLLTKLTLRQPLTCYRSIEAMLGKRPW